MKKTTQILASLGVAMLLLFPSLSWGRTISATANTFWPAIDDSPYLMVLGSQTLQQWQFRAGTYFHYAKNPLEVGLAGTRRFGIIDHLLVMDNFGSIGFTDWFQA